MNWEIGLAIQKHILQGKRAGYGDEIIKTLSTELTSEFGKGFSKASLHHCVRIAETFPERQIVYALSRKLSWTHFRQVQSQL